MKGRKPVECAGPGCATTFVPRATTTRYCSKRCKDRSNYRTAPSRARAYAAERNAEKRAAVRALKAVPCADCGGSWPHYVMDFDHVRGEKLGEVSEMLRCGYSLATILAEIAKCDVVCANCHRERTHG